ncbi:uncharacterized protein PAC_05542 [Phialocephala subalpina]|uniref:Uncharacterized protein n=1 Tax=Phialocephala subalpina TaxID=576137 RepID=A0A1L7WS99_9HELO|nr:uncharacterized protein PAC_05542 [Phialocephala subalpina]
MSVQEAMEARAEFRRRQRERRAQGGLRRRKHQRRDDDKPKSAAVGDETPSEGDDSPSEDESSTKFSQIQTSTASQVTQITLSTSSASSVQAITTTNVASQTSTTVKASILVTTPLASHPTSTTPPATTSLPASSKASSSVATTFPPFSTPLAVTTPPAVTSSSFSSSIQTTSTSSSSAAAQTAGSGISSKQSSNQSGSNNSTAIIFGVVGAFAGIFAILAVAFFVRRRFFRPKGPKPTVNQQEARAYAARSIWGTSSTSSSDDHSRTTMAQFVPPITMSPNQVGDRNGPGNDAVDRQERLQRVRTDILGEREMQLGSGLGSIKQPGRAWGPGKFQRLDEKAMARAAAERDGVDIEVNDGMWEPPRTVAARDSRAMTEVSLPRWRDPITWARDQARRNNSRGAGDM